MNLLLFWASGRCRCSEFGCDEVGDVITVSLDSSSVVGWPWTIDARCAWHTVDRLAGWTQTGLYRWHVRVRGFGLLDALQRAADRMQFDPLRSYETGDGYGYGNG